MIRHTMYVVLSGGVLMFKCLLSPSYFSFSFGTCCSFLKGIWKMAGSCHVVEDPCFFMDILKRNCLCLFPLCFNVQKHLSKKILTSTVCTVTEWLELLVKKKIKWSLKIWNLFLLFLLWKYSFLFLKAFLVVKYLFNYWWLIWYKYSKLKFSKM